MLNDIKQLAMILARFSLYTTHDTNSQSCKKKEEGNKERKKKGESGEMCLVVLAAVVVNGIVLFSIADIL